MSGIYLLVQDELNTPSFIAIAYRPLRVGRVEVVAVRRFNDGSDAGDGFQGM